MKRKMIIATILCALFCTSLFAQEEWNEGYELRRLNQKTAKLSHKAHKRLTIKDIKSKEIALDKTIITGENADLLNTNKAKISIQERKVFHWPEGARKLGYRKINVLCICIPTSYSVQWNESLDASYWPYLRYHVGLKDANKNKIPFQTSSSPELDLYVPEDNCLSAELEWYPEEFSFYDSRKIGAEFGEGGGMWSRSFRESYGIFYHREGIQEYDVPGLVTGTSEDSDFFEDEDKYFTLFMADPLSYYEHSIYDAPYYFELELDDRAFPIPELLHHQDTVYMFVEGSLNELKELFNKIEYLVLDDVHLMHRKVDQILDMKIDSATDKLETLLQQLGPRKDIISTDTLLEIINLFNIFESNIIESNSNEFGSTDLSFLRSNRYVKLLRTYPLSHYQYLISSRYERVFNQWDANTHLQFARSCWNSAKNYIYHENDFISKDRWVFMALTSYFISAMSGNQDAFKEMRELVQNGDITDYLLQEYFLKNLIDGKFTFNTEKKNLYDLNEEMYQFAIKNFSEDFQIYKEKYIDFDLER